MKSILVIVAVLLSQSYALANIDDTIEEFTGLMEEAKAQVGIGYNIDSMSRNADGFGYKVVLTKLLGAGKTECYSVVPKPRGTKSRLIYTKINCSAE